MTYDALPLDTADKPKQSEVRPFQSNEGNFLHPFHCSTEAEALAYKAVHGGYVMRSPREGWDVVYPRDAK